METIRLWNETVFRQKQRYVVAENYRRMAAMIMPVLETLMNFGSVNVKTQIYTG